MKALSNNIRQVFKDTLLFTICYFITFGVLIYTFSDGGQTTGTFILIDFLLIFLISVYYFIFILAIKAANKSVGLFTKVFVFFIIAELSALTVTGQIPFFGLLQKYIYSQTSTSAFRQGRDLAFSLAGLISALVFLIAKRRSKQQLPIKNISHESSA